MYALNDVVEELTTYKDEKTIYNAYYYYFVDRNVLFYVEQKEDSLYMRVLNDENFEPLCIF